MIKHTPPPDTAAILGELKDFQRKTVDYVFERLYRDPQPTRRFLVADEVGLGKTLVARGIIARAIEHLWNKVPRIDIVYICSNGDIARQNIRRLNFTGQNDIAFSTRITLLPLETRTLQANRINFVSFTPRTSFEMGESLGVMRERALLFWLLHQAWGFNPRRKGPDKLFQGRASLESFRWQLNNLDRRSIDPAAAARFVAALQQREPHQQLQTRFEKLAERFAQRQPPYPEADRRERNQLVKELRTILAEAALAGLDPDIVILDEFQRFKELLDDQFGNETNELANHLFNYADTHTQTRVLLLSATPYKMYTLSHERDNGGDDHYQDFLRTISFLNAAQARQFERLISDYRQELFRIGQSNGATLDRVITAKKHLETLLRQVMVRTERLAVQSNRDGMLKEIPGQGVQLAPQDLLAYLTYQQVARHLKHHDILEYWKSAPYLLNFMDSYQLKQLLRAAIAHTDQSALLADALRDAGSALLSWQDIEHYRPIDPHNARLRSLRADVIERGAWQLLWIPPSLPYYKLAGPFDDPALAMFTKRLVFSSWQIVPKVIATLMSYEAERQTAQASDKALENTPEGRERHSRLLDFTPHAERMSGMPVLGMLYPSMVLAQFGDPLRVAQDSPTGAGLLDLPSMLQRIREQIAAKLRPLIADRPRSGPEDQSWYWAAPLLLDQSSYPAGFDHWFGRPNLPNTWAGGGAAHDQDDRSGWAQHVKRAGDMMHTWRQSLGRPPTDLADVLALLALGGPGVTALRALWRIASLVAPKLAQHKRIESVAIRDAAAQIAWGFRSLYNQPEATAIVRSVTLPGATPDTPYWRRVLLYGAAGGLQSVLDEYAHILIESLSLQRAGIERAVAECAATLRDVLSLRSAPLGVDAVVVDGASVHLDSHRMRSHFAIRFGEEQIDDPEKNRKEKVRQAFNAPFWPFVLATTSVGQEGLDFHSYCHAVVHWNLPANPVDLEQREGRVHRYKGHAVRKNVAEAFGAQYLRLLKEEPWTDLFDRAKQHRSDGTSDLEPYWVFQGSAHIERHVPALPLSRDLDRLAALCRSLTIYRMVFGQNRQEDLLNYLLDILPAEKIETLAQQLCINLEPQ